MNTCEICNDPIEREGEQFCDSCIVTIELMFDRMYDMTVN